ncbi:recombinase family protein [Kitasatospora sp. NPDC088351]|uniref:recombinase family protein n=1 Tax=Kitasatospora sp. NPDC088351 TaxID=3155180 RepID=UPI00343C4A60
MPAYHHEPPTMHPSTDPADWPEIDLYLRKSKIVRESDKRDITSVRAQESEGREWAVRNHYRVRKVWVDNLSAWSDVARPGFDNALTAVLDDQVPVLWCFALDRYTRKGTTTSARSWARPGSSSTGRPPVYRSGAGKRPTSGALRREQPAITRSPITPPSPPGSRCQAS